MAKKLVKNNFWIFLAQPPPPPQKRYLKKNCQNEKKLKLFKIAWNGQKFGQFFVCDFLAHHPQEKGYLKICCQNEEKKEVVQNCLKWRENWSKLIFLQPPHPKKGYFFFQKLKKSKLFKIAWNDEKIENDCSEMGYWETVLFGKVGLWSLCVSGIRKELWEPLHALHEKRTK